MVRVVNAHILYNWVNKHTAKSVTLLEFMVELIRELSGNSSNEALLQRRPNDLRHFILDEDDVDGSLPPRPPKYKRTQSWVSDNTRYQCRLSLCDQS
jgi:hypothetical protein